MNLRNDSEKKKKKKILNAHKLKNEFNAYLSKSRVNFEGGEKLLRRELKGRRET